MLFYMYGSNYIYTLSPKMTTLILNIPHKVDIQASQASCAVNWFVQFKNKKQQQQQTKKGSTSVSNFSLT